MKLFLEFLGFGPRKSDWPQIEVIFKIKIRNRRKIRNARLFVTHFDIPEKFKNP